MINDVRETSDLYAVVEFLYECLRLMDVREKYNGLKLKRLLNTCWSGYPDCVKVINSKTNQIIACLKEYISTTSVQSEHKVVCKELRLAIIKFAIHFSF